MNIDVLSQSWLNLILSRAAERVFNRIDASKLQGALENASMLKKLEKEGVAPELLPGVAKGMQEEKNKPKEKQLKVRSMLLSNLI